MHRRDKEERTNLAPKAQERPISAPPSHPWYRWVFGYVDRKDIPWAWLGWILLAAALYSGIALWLTPGEFWAWLSTFVATLLSVLAAIGLYRHQGNRAEMEKLYRLYMTLDADVESLLTRIDPSRSEVKPLSITLPTGRIASAIVSRGEYRMPMAEEVARAGLQTRRESLLYFMMASTIRGYALASSDYIALYHAASTAPGVGGNTEEAILHSASTVERMRAGLIENCEKLREYLAHWLEANRDFYPWGAENEDPTPEWCYFLRATEGEVALDPQDAIEDGGRDTEESVVEDTVDLAWQSSLFNWRRTLSNEKLEELRQQVIRYFRSYYVELRSEIDKQQQRLVPDYVKGYKKIWLELGDDGAIVTHQPYEGDEDVFQFSIAQGYSAMDIAHAKVGTGPFDVAVSILDYEPGSDFGEGTHLDPLELQQGDTIYRTNWVRLDYASWLHLDVWRDQSDARQKARNDFLIYVESEKQEI